MLEVTNKIFSDNVDHKTMDQFRTALSATGVVRGALMPDCHAGYTSPVGCVLETKNILYPAVVGYDIGCGVLSVPIEIPYELVWDNAMKIRNAILDMIHVGVGKNYSRKGSINTPVDDALFGEYARDIGTLGGGNHFIEIGVDDSTKQVWITVHSGSRGFGHGIGTKYMTIAKEINNASNMEAMNGIMIHDPMFSMYLKDHYHAVLFAQKNRQALANSVIKVLENAYGPRIVKINDMVHCMHNFLEIDADTGNLIHRKGATSAKAGEVVAIPGSMKDGVVIGVGKGSIDGIKSCSHGAGRKLSRSQAKSVITLEDFQQSMRGIPGAMVSMGHIDESPGVYKDIWEVMENQKELVEVTRIIRPIVNIKGG